MAAPGLSALFGAGAGKLLEKGVEEIKKLRESVDDLRSEWGSRQALPVGQIAWDRVVLITVPTNSDLNIDLVKEHGAPAIDMAVLDAAASPNEPKIGINGSEAFSVVTGDDFSNGRIYNVRVNNPSGGSAVDLLFFLTSAKAGGRGPWA